MNKTIVLSFVTVLCLNAQQVELETIDVETSVTAEVLKDVSGEELKSADLGEALFKQSPSVSLVRRSGIANDIGVRGQKKDNISVTIDGTKIHGACPNRMDPPISHVLTNNVDYIEINEGPFNVEDFGVLSADVKVHTINPEAGFNGSVDLGMGSFSYQKETFSLSGGTDTVRFLLSGSTEKGEQYQDGNGDDFVGQIDSNILAGNVSPSAQYQDKYKDLDAFQKETLMAKMFWDITDTQELRLSYTANRSDNILYPSTKMDALYDDSDIYNIEYISKDLGRYSKELYLQAYQSEVEHPMSTKYRQSAIIDSNPMMPGVQMMYMTHALTTKTKGGKIKNSFDIDNHTMTVGIDHSVRNWDGKYYKNDIPLDIASEGMNPFHSIWDVDTTNTAVFVDDTIKMDKLIVELGFRYDNTQVEATDLTQQSNNYDELNGYILGTYHTDTTTSYFAGLGKSSRVPDAKELYWIGAMGNPVGTPDLKHTVNYEFDVGMQKQFENATIKVKAFYSKLDDYIAYNASNTQMIMVMGQPKNVSWNAYENVDATVYGFDLSGTYIATDSVYFDYAMAFQRGKKDKPLNGQVGTDMADIAPFKFNGAVNYDYDSALNFRAEIIATDDWDTIDYENGEQFLDDYMLVNLKASKQFGKDFELTLGVDNIFDETYAVSNTYKDLILLSTPGNEVMLMNEPGRYFYANLRYTF